MTKSVLVTSAAGGTQGRTGRHVSEMLLKRGARVRAFVRQIARKVTVLHQGHVLCEGTVDDVQNDERVLDVYLGRKKQHG